MENTEKIIVGYDAETDARAAEKTTVSRRIAEARADRTAGIGVENKSLRTANARHYIGVNGERKAVITGAPRHYYSVADKRMRRIDNTLELKNGAYENRYNAFKVRFAADATDDGIMRVSQGDHEIAFSLADDICGNARVRRRMCGAVLRDVISRMTDIADDKLESGIGYPEIFDGVDFEYEVKPDGIKENITLNKQLDGYEFDFIVSTKGLRVEIDDENNTVAFYAENADGDAEPIFTMPAPYMFDGNGATSHAVKYATEKISPERYLLKLLPDAQWINSADRAFPVTVDPTIISKFKSDLNLEFIKKDANATGGLYASIADHHILGFEEGSVCKRNEELYLYVGLDGLKNIAEMRDGEINSATLYFAIGKDRFLPQVMNANGYFSIYGVPANTALDFATLEKLQSDVLANAKPVCDENKFYYMEFDISSAIAKEYTGFVIKANRANNSSSQLAQNYAFIITNDVKTQLYVSYTPKSHVRGNKSISAQCNSAGTGAIDLFTGDLTFVHDILSFDGAQLPMNISLVYDSDRYKEYELNGYGCGNGWRLNFMQTIERMNVPTVGGNGDIEYYEYTDAAGNKQEICTRYYKETDSDDKNKTIKLYGSYAEGCGLLSEISNDNYVLTKTFDENKAENLVLTDRAGNRMVFKPNFSSSMWLLASVEKPETTDRPTLKMTVRYNGNSIVVTDASGRTLTFEFDPFSYGSILKRIKYDGKEIFSVSYSELDLGYCIDTVTTPQGDISFGCDGRGCFNKITDPSGYTLEYKISYVDNKPKMGGYYIKSSVDEISYAENDWGGLTIGSEKISENITVEYDSGISDSVFTMSENVKNLTTVTDADGVKTHYFFDPRGAVKAVIDGKGNIEAYSTSVKTKKISVSATNGNTYVFANEVQQSTASAYGDADPLAAINPTDIRYFFGRTFIKNDPQADDETFLWSAMNTSRLATGWYIFMTKLTGRVAAGVRFDDLTDAGDRRIPYVALRVRKTYNISGKETIEEDYVRAESTGSGNGKAQFMFMPFYVDGKNLTYMRADIVTEGNPNDVFMEQWRVVRAAQGSKVTIKDTDVAVSETYAEGLYTATTTDISKRKNNTRVTTVRRGNKSTQTVVAQYDSAKTSDGKYKYPERVVKEDRTGHQYNGDTEKEYTYDGFGNITSETVKEKYNSKRQMRRDCTYESENGSAVGYKNMPMRVTGEDGNEIKYDYTNEGYIKRTTLPGTNVNIDYTYNGIDGLLKKIRSDDAENTFAYNCGYLTKLDHHGCEYGFKYDGFGRMTEITVGGEKYIQTRYAEHGTDIDGVTGATSKTTVEYIGERTVKPAPYCGMTTSGQDYTRAATEQTDGQVYASYYNKFGELLKVRYAKNTDINHAFTSADDYVTVEEEIYGPKTVRYTVGTTVYEYSYITATGELIDSVEYEAGNEKQRASITERDEYGKVKSMTYTLNESDEMSYGYEYSPVLDAVTEVTMPNAAKERCKIDAFGRYIGRIVETDEKDFDEDLYFKTIERDGVQYTTPLVSEMRTSIAGNYRHIYKYEYDANGNITSITDNATFIVSYVYDGLNRLVRENNARDNTVTVYIYDNAGNITSKKLFDYTSYANTDTLTLKNSPHGKTVGYTYMSTGNKDRLLTYNGSEALSYDKHGNPQKWFKHGTTSQLKYSLLWEQVNRLTAITDKETNNKYEYTYNYQGIRTQKKVGDTEYKYYLDGKKIIQETRTTGSEVEKIQYYYGATGIVGFNYKGENYYFLKNIQGDIIGIYDSEGNIYGEYSYDTWGKCTIVTDKYGIATINPFRYRGYYLDNETGLCYLNSRYYDPVVGRFLSPDSLEYLDPESLGGLNLYSYCNNNPVMYVDPNGNSFALISFLIGLGIAAAIGATVGAVSYASSVLIIGIFTGEFSWSWGMFLGAIIGGAIGGMLTFAFRMPIGLGAAITGGLSTAIGMSLSNAFGESNYSGFEILGWTFVSVGLSALATGIMNKIKIPGLTGRGSYGQVTKQIFTKFYNGLIRSISAKTFGKMLMYNLAYNALNILADGIIGIIQNFTQKKKKKKPQEFIMGA